MTPEEKKAYAKEHYRQHAAEYKQRARDRYARVHADPEEDEKRKIQVREANKRFYDKKTALDPAWVEQRRAEKRADYAANPELFKARTAARRTPEAQRRYQLKTKYGISVEEFEAMLEAQDKRCVVCKCTIDAPTPDEKGWNYRAVDHDHESNRVRAILCRRCNVVLGQVGDSVELLEAFIAYLRYHKQISAGSA